MAAAADAASPLPGSAPRARVIVVLGAESTGKTVLAQALAAALAARGAGRVTWVPEVLRQWCDAHGRTPRADEQAAIAQAQHARIDAAAACHDVVVCDTTAVMTAVYSRVVFGDATLDAAALALHRAAVDTTLVTALDLPWVADGLQRDGPHAREPVDAALRALLWGGGVPFAVIGGHGGQRLAQALAAVAPRHAHGRSMAWKTVLPNAAAGAGAVRHGSLCA